MDIEKLKEEFEKDFPSWDAGCDGCHESQDKQEKIFNWFVEKIKKLV